MLDIDKNPIEDLKKLNGSKIQQVAEVNIRKIPTLDNNVFCADQKLDITCKQLASQAHCGS